MEKERYTIKQVNDREQYEGLRALWCAVFGDSPEYVDHTYRSFGMDPDLFPHAGSRAGSDPELEFTGTEIAGYIITDDSGRTVSALTCYKCGTYALPAPMDESEEPLFDLLNGKPVYVSYAICTDPEFRSQGLAAWLTGHVKDIVTQQGGLSVVSPAEPSLQDFYEALGYEPHFFAQYGAAFSSQMDGDEELMQLAFDEDDDVSIWGGDDMDEPFGSFDPGLSIIPIGASMYNKYREAFLADIPHIALSEKMIDFIKAESANGNGLYLINNGDAICMMQTNEASDGTDEQVVTELLVNPMLTDISLEIDIAIASKMADQLEMDQLHYRTPGYGRCQTMLAGQPLMDTIMGFYNNPAYYGFPIE